MTRRRRRALRALTAILTATVLLVGCTHSPVDDVLASGEESALPSSVDEGQAAAVLPETTRFLGEDAQGHRYYVAESSSEYGWPRGICLILDGLDAGPMMGCGSLPLSIESEGIRARLGAVVYDDEGGEQITDHLVVFDAE